MGIRLPLKTVAQFTDTNETGAGSVAGGIPHTFTLPQDCESVVVKMTASVAGTGVSAVLQTSDDGGTSYYDVARTSIVSNGAIPTFCGASLNPTVATGVNGFPANSVLSVGIANTAPSTLGQNQVSGLPILGTHGRVFIRINGNVTSAASNQIVTTVMTNSQARN